MFLNRIVAAFRAILAQWRKKGDPKKRILEEFWKRDASGLQHDFGQTGIMQENGTVQRGTGYVFEALCKYSARLPKNTESAQRIADILIRILARNELNTRTAGMPATPDFLWLDVTGTHVTLLGIGEAKSFITLERSHILYHQLYWEQKNAGKLFSALNALAPEEIKRIFGREYSFSLKYPLELLVIVPSDATELFAGYLERGWRIREVEFSAEELYDLCAELWLEFGGNPSPP